MKVYPSIQHSSKAPRQACYGFTKYDGSNIRIEFSRKNGWHKFGTRKQMFDRTEPTFGEAIDLFINKYGSDLKEIFKHKDFRGVDSFTCFAEFFGKSSFAGQHVMGEAKDIVLFDVNPNKKGFLSPKEFLDYFGHLAIAECVYQGNLNEQIIQAVKNSDYEFVDFRSKYKITTDVPEGVICKGGSGHKLWMCKIKTNNYLYELKNKKPLGWEKLVQEDFGEL